MSLQLRDFEPNLIGFPVKELLCVLDMLTEGRDVFLARLELDLFVFGLGDFLAVKLLGWQKFLLEKVETLRAFLAPFIK